MGQKTISTPVGALTLSSNGHAITRVTWPRSDDITTDCESEPILEAAALEIRKYFSGMLTEFRVPVHLEGSALQLGVWKAIRAIPFGRVLTYGDVAKAIGSEPQAVGTACGQNPIPVIVPCHRIVGAGGRLTGFSGGAGIETKSFLLDLESGQGRLL